ETGRGSTLLRALYYVGGTPRGSPQTPLFTLLTDTDQGFEQFEVEAQVGISAWGRTRAEAFAQAALGVLSLTADPATVSPRETREVRAQADSPETLLVAWIDECLYVHEIEAFVVSRVELVSCSDTVAIGQLYGEPLDAGRPRLG